jgi:hypothetical protein
MTTMEFTLEALETPALTKAHLADLLFEQIRRLRPTSMSCPPNIWAGLHQTCRAAGGSLGHPGHRPGKSGCHWHRQDQGPQVHGFPRAGPPLPRLPLSLDAKRRRPPQSRILSSLKGLQNRYGLNDFTVIGRDGEVFAHIGSQPAATEKRNIKKDPILVAGFAQEAHTVSTLMDDDAVTYIAPVVLNGEREFVISIEQDLSAYEKVLALGLGRSLYVGAVKPDEALAASRA